LMFGVMGEFAILMRRGDVKPAWPCLTAGLALY
jgi:hypothetical protein